MIYGIDSVPTVTAPQAGSRIFLSSTWKGETGMREEDISSHQKQLLAFEPNMP